MSDQDLAQGVPVDRPAELGGQEAECIPKCSRQVAGIRVAELPCERGEPSVRIGQPVEGGPHPQLVSIAEEREASALAEDAAQLEAGDGQRRGDLGHRQALAVARDEKLLRLVDDLPASRARRLALLRVEFVKATRALDRALDSGRQRLLGNALVGTRLPQMPDRQPLEQEDEGVAGAEDEGKAPHPAREAVHELWRQLDEVAVVAGRGPERPEEPRSGVVEDDLIPVADDGVPPELANGHRRPRKDHVRFRRDAVQAVPARAVGGAPELAGQQPLVRVERPADRVRVHVSVQTSGGVRSSVPGPCVKPTTRRLGLLRQAESLIVPPRASRCHGTCGRP